MVDAIKTVFAMFIVGAGIVGTIALIVALFAVMPLVMALVVGVPGFVAAFAWAVNHLQDEAEELYGR